jgi:hypothetical protein
MATVCIISFTCTILGFRHIGSGASNGSWMHKQLILADMTLRNVLLTELRFRSDGLDCVIVPKNPWYRRTVLNLPEASRHQGKLFRQPHARSSLGPRAIQQSIPCINFHSSYSTSQYLINQLEK